MGRMYVHRLPVSTDVKDIDVAMVIPSKERLPGGVKGHVEEAHGLALFATADYCYEDTAKDKE